MRLWKNANGDLIGDEQVLAYVASHGSLSAAFSAGDISLVAGEQEVDRPRNSRDQLKGRRDHAKLATFL